jgi:AbrB family looped-hinge helix DNA binding protein
MKITSKGQVTIPVEIREQLGLLPETNVEFKVVKDGVLITKSKKPGRGKSIINHMRGKATTGMTTDEIMALMRGDS